MPADGRGDGAARRPRSTGARGGRHVTVYDNLKDAIVTGTLRPMERITEHEVAARFGLSRTPVREAFRRLQAEGLILVVPQRGSFVSQPNLEDILEIYQIRTPLECMAARIAAETIEDTKLAVLEDLVRIERGRMHQQARRLVDRDQVIVEVQQSKRRVGAGVDRRGIQVVRCAHGRILNRKVPPSLRRDGGTGGVNAFMAAAFSRAPPWPAPWP